ncbi:MAG: tRNA (adenosine(37)-N6)-threonylcarbamoyltransferase complex transferase subunit TsaD [Chlamydiota bacterium]
MLILGLESSCDDTCAAVVACKSEPSSNKNAPETGKKRRRKARILSNIISSQEEIHATFGGIFPEVAARKHVENFLPVIEEALLTANVTLDQLDLIAATRGPGLTNSLLVCLTAGKTLAYALEKPFVAVNHIEAHLYPTLFASPPLPAIGVILSGGHTTMVLIEEGQYTHIGSTVDDAIGEALDKVAHLLGYPYPGGREIEKQALVGDKNAYPFRGGQVRGNPLAFSFSGPKTAFLYRLPPGMIDEKTKADLAASFQNALFQDVIQKMQKAEIHYAPQSFLFGGGVVQNKTLQKLCHEQLSSPCFFPPPALSSDNAAMIGMAAYEKWQTTGADPLDIPAASRLPFFLV